ncbi:MAG: hypothetical protein MK096_08090 [Oleiphilaceae bacterium]|uniref:hypothetical protein n=1 Tax=Oleiphilus sp. HI0125 TaxID=1822266 RepID=UPI0007C1FD93|nr:hypothetical protein [Oleiphilus sp. HI0125]KZZ57200.1 hypothetical protein A3762_20055 [Oleiphilus sp. HI0125]KZZ59283.1 hypothetical protein A3762_05375 [Oleiphilus sp. HI0125]MCH2158717.1 hypothetical protein [Oleiphilaceae bacterium]
MQVGNPSINLTSLQPGATEKRQDQKQAQQVLEAPMADARVVASPEVLREAELRQVERLEQLQRSENLTGRNKQALQEYFATEQAGQSYQGGELLGIDIYV